VVSIIRSKQSGRRQPLSLRVSTKTQGVRGSILTSLGDPARGEGQFHIRQRQLKQEGMLTFFPINLVLLEFITIS
jgi:hypothetical protein